MTSGPGGTPRALVAVQRFGEGRSMVFTGEASWRWRMLLPATDRSLRHVLEAGAALAGARRRRSDSADGAAGGAPGDTLPLRVVARNAAFEPLPNASVDVRVTAPDGRVESLRAAPDPSP